ncbi:MAG: carboxypeptidase regulatory-like domain-containing protein [Acidobacteria bacterium]|nr:carboxypeptidase regulatory-like domain-containing protein [Acidobacteriota bacterium]
MKKTPRIVFFRQILVILLLFFCLIKEGYSQSFAGRLVGSVRDPEGAVIGGISIVIENEATGIKREVVSSDNGNFVVPELPPGYYSISIDSENFASTTRKQVKIDVGVETQLELNLQVRASQQVIIITGATAPVLQSSSSQLTETINNQQIDGLPLNGRDFRRLTTLVPGVSPRSPRGSLGSLTVNGQREKANIFLIDGIDNNDSFRNQPSFNQGGVTGAPATLVPIDALAEFSLQLQGAAEYGRNSGAVFNIVVKSGTNDFHGSLYEFLRNDNFDARNFFETIPGATKGEFKNNNFGGVVGGPIIRNRTFFFFGFEGQRERANSPLAVVVPSASDIVNARAANNSMGRRENPLSTVLLKLFPSENNPGARNNFAFSSNNINDSDNFLVKIDHKIRENLNLSGRYVFGDGMQIFPLTSGFGSPLSQYQTVVPTRVQLVGLNLVQLFGNNILNETRVGYNRFFQDFSPLDKGFDPASIGLITGSTGGLPTITLAGFTSLGAPTNVPRGRVSSAFQLVDNFTLISGSHTYKIGGEYRRAIVNSFNDTFSRGRIDFSNLANFLAGIAVPTNTTIARGATRRDTFNNTFAFFFQDDWKIRRNLTLNYGIRYEYVGVFSDENDRLSNFVPNLGLVRVGATGLSELYEPDHNNFAPRIGFAYDFHGKNRLIIRGGYGIFYDALSQDFFLSQGFAAGSVGTNPIAGLGTFTVNFAPTARVPFGLNIPIFTSASINAVAAAPLFAVDRKLRTPYSQNFNLNVQYAVRANTVLQISYVGSTGTRLFRLRDINQPTPGPIATRQSRRPFNTQFPQFSSINYLETTANSNYHALQTFVRQRFSNGLDFFLSYTYSKSIDDASNGIFSGTRGVSFPQDSNNLRAERSVSNFDIKNRFTFNFVYELNFLPKLLNRLPKAVTEGWQLSGIYTLSTGFPATAFLSTDVSGVGNFNDRPNAVSDPNSGLEKVNSFFNTKAFSLPRTGTFGTAGRNTIIGPRFNVADFSINKRTKISEKLAIQFRAEIFNIFNHPNFGLPNVQFDSSGFGAIGETPDISAGNPKLGEGGPRVIQFGIKLIF